MAFVNEYVSAEDKTRIDFASIPRRPHDDVKLHSVNPHRWTIDRERDVILIWTWSGREENSKSNYFLYVCAKLVSGRTTLTASSHGIF